MGSRGAFHPGGLNLLPAPKAQPECWAPAAIGTLTERVVPSASHLETLQLVEVAGAAPEPKVDFQSVSGRANPGSYSSPPSSFPAGLIASIGGAADKSAAAAALGLSNDGELQDYLAALVLSECVYKKLEMSSSELAKTISEYTSSFPPGWLTIESVQISVDSIEQHYLVASGSGSLYVAFMGTKQARDLVSDAHVVPKPVWAESVALAKDHRKIPSAHTGFLERARSINVAQLYDLAVDNGKKLVLCGHSLGGAVAKLCTLQLLRELPQWSSPKVSCICFATPAIGNSALADYVVQAGWAPYFKTFLLPEDQLIRIVSFIQPKSFSRPSNIYSKHGSASTSSLQGLMNVVHTAKEGVKEVISRSCSLASTLSSSASATSSASTLSMDEPLTGQDTDLSASESHQNIISSIDMSQEEEDAVEAALEDILTSRAVSPSTVQPEELGILDAVPQLIQALALSRAASANSLSSSNAHGPSTKPGLLSPSSSPSSELLSSQVNVPQGSSSPSQTDCVTSHPLPRQRSLNLALALVLQRKKLLRHVRRLLRRAHMSLPRLPFELPEGSFHGFGTHMFLFSTQKSHRSAAPVAEASASAQHETSVPLMGTKGRKSVPGGLFNYHRMISYRLRTLEIISQYVQHSDKQHITEPRHLGSSAPVSLQTLVPSVSVTSAAARLPLDLMVERELRAESTDKGQATKRPRFPQARREKQEEDTVTLDVQVEGINFHYNKVVSAKIEGHPFFPEGIQLEAHVADMTRIPAGATKSSRFNGLKSEPAARCSLRPKSMLTRVTGYLSRHTCEAPRTLEDVRDPCHMTVRLAVSRSHLAALMKSAPGHRPPGRTAHFRASRIRALPSPPQQTILLRLGNDFGEVTTSVQLMPYYIAIWGTSSLASSLVHSALRGPASTPMVASQGSERVSVSQLASQDTGTGIESAAANSSPSTSPPPWWWPQPLRWATELSNCACGIREGLMSSVSKPAEVSVSVDASSRQDLAEGRPAAQSVGEEMQSHPSTPAAGGASSPVPISKTGLLRRFSQVAYSSLSTSPTQRGSAAVHASPIDLGEDASLIDLGEDASPIDLGEDASPIDLGEDAAERYGRAGDEQSVGQDEAEEHQPMRRTHLPGPPGRISSNIVTSSPASGAGNCCTDDQDPEGTRKSCFAHEETALLTRNDTATDVQGHDGAGKQVWSEEAGAEAGKASNVAGVVPVGRRYLCRLFNRKSRVQELSDDPYEHLVAYGWRPLRVRACVRLLMRLLARRRRASRGQVDGSRQATPQTRLYRLYRLQVARLTRHLSRRQQAKRAPSNVATEGSRVGAATGVAAAKTGRASASGLNTTSTKKKNPLATDPRVRRDTSGDTDEQPCPDSSTPLQLPNKPSLPPLMNPEVPGTPDLASPVRAYTSDDVPQTLEGSTPDVQPAANSHRCAQSLKDDVPASNTATWEDEFSPLLDTSQDVPASCSTAELHGTVSTTRLPTWSAWRAYNFQLSRLSQVMLLKRWLRRPAGSAAASCSTRARHADANPAYNRRTCYSKLLPILQYMWYGSRAARSFSARTPTPSQSDSVKGMQDSLGCQCIGPDTRMAAATLTSRRGMASGCGAMRHCQSASHSLSASGAASARALTLVHAGQFSGSKPSQRRLVRTLSAPSVGPCCSVDSLAMAPGGSTAFSSVSKSRTKPGRLQAPPRGNNGGGAVVKQAAAQSLEGPVMYHDVMASAPMVSPFVLLRALLAAIKQQGLNGPWWRQVVSGFAKLLLPANSIMGMYYFVRGLPLWWMKAVRHVVDLNLSQNWSVLLVAVDVTVSMRALQGSNFRALVHHAQVAHVALQPVLLAPPKFPTNQLASKIELLSRMCKIPLTAVRVLTIDEIQLDQGSAQTRIVGEAAGVAELREALHKVLLTGTVES